LTQIEGTGVIAGFSWMQTIPKTVRAAAIDRFGGPEVYFRN
jgi:hypothetical protein